MKIKKGEISIIVFAFLTGLFFILNNLFESNYISQNRSALILGFLSCVCAFGYAFMLKRLVIKQLCVCFAICTVGGFWLNLLLGPALWIRYIVLFLWIIAGCFLLYTSLRNAKEKE